MHIEWRRVTWYSRLLAFCLFITLPLVGFWAGIEYARTIGPLTFSGTPDHLDGSSTVPDQPSMVDDDVEAQDIVAQNVVAIPTDKTLTFSQYPDVTFRITRVSRANGGVPVAMCGGGNFMFIRYTHIFSPPGACLDATKTLSDGAPLALAVVDLEIDNRSNQFVDGRFVQLLMTRTRDGAVHTDRAVENPGWTSYGARPFSTRRMLLGFEVPRDLDEYQLIFGDYGRTSMSPISDEEFFSKTIGGYIVDFDAKIVADIPG